MQHSSDECVRAATTAADDVYIILSNPFPLAEEGINLEQVERTRGC